MANKSPLSASHQAWLDSHPHRTRGWLKTAISEGFEVHHIDRDRDNNAPENLVLIEIADHTRLHRGHFRGPPSLGYPTWFGRQMPTWAEKLRFEQWAWRQHKLRRACRATLYFLDGYDVPRGDMRFWWQEWGGGRKWMHHARRKNRIYGVGLGQMPLGPYWRAPDMDQDSGGYNRG